MEYQKYIIDTECIPLYNNDKFMMQLDEENEKEIEKLKQSYEDFKVLTRGLINDYKRNKLKNIKKKEK